MVKSKRNTILIVAGSVLLLVAIVVTLWFVLFGTTSVYDPNAVDGQAPHKSQEEMDAESNRQIETGAFNLSIATEINFLNGDSYGEAYIENVPNNPYYMQVTITDDDTGDLLYQSGIIKPNQYIKDIRLMKDLPKGEYTGLALFTAIDPETMDAQGQAAAKIKLNVLY